MKIYGIKDNVCDAVDCIVNYGVTAVEGTKTSAVEYANKIIENLASHPNVSPIIGYQNVHNQGCLYYVYDSNRFSIGDEELEKTINKIDAENA